MERTDLPLRGIVLPKYYMTRIKNKTLLVRITEKQQRDLERAAKRSGLAVSDYVRQVLALTTQSKTVGEFVDKCLEG